MPAELPDADAAAPPGPPLAAHGAEAIAEKVFGARTVVRAPSLPNQVSVEPTNVLLDEAFDERGLFALRRAVAAHAAAGGLSERQTGHLVLVVHELAANAVRHAGGRGWVRLWRTGTAWRCQVSDTGSTRTDFAGLGVTAPPPGVVGGRGLWLVRQLAGHLDIRTGPDGTHVTATIEQFAPLPP